MFGIAGQLFGTRPKSMGGRERRGARRGAASGLGTKAKLIPYKLQLSEKICRAQSLQVSQTAWLIAGGNETDTVPGSGSRRSISSATTEYE